MAKKKSKLMDHYRRMKAVFPGARLNEEGHALKKSMGKEESERYRSAGKGWIVGSLPGIGVAGTVAGVGSWKSGRILKPWLKSQAVGLPLALGGAAAGAALAYRSKKKQQQRMKTYHPVRHLNKG